MSQFLTNVTNTGILRLWAVVNIALITENVSGAACRALEALNRCTRLDSWFPDIVQPLHLFFEHTEVYEQGTGMLFDMDPKYLLQASFQILVQLSHREERVVCFMVTLIGQLLRSHFHSLLFSMRVMETSDNKTRRRHTAELLEKFKAANSEVYNEVDLIRRSMLKAAVTWYERALLRLQDVEDFERCDQRALAVEALEKILSFIKHASCQLHEQLFIDFGRELSQIRTEIGRD
jgi:hypothetical protein